MKIKVLTVAVMIVAFGCAGVAMAQQNSPTPTPTPAQPKIGFRQQGFEPSPSDPLSKPISTKDEKSVPNGQRKQSVKPTRKEQAQPTVDLNKLRQDYINTTKELKASLERLLALYEASESKAEARYAQSQKLFEAGLISKPQLEENERAITIGKEKVSGVKQQIASADTQIAQTLIEISKPENTAKLAREYKRASARQPTCRNWTLTASRHQRGRTVTVAFKLVCKD